MNADRVPTTTNQPTLVRRDATPFPSSLRKVFLQAFDAPLFERLFDRCETPRSWEDWYRLPTTAPEDYANAGFDSFRSGGELYSPVAPFDLDAPSFPQTVLQSYADKLKVDARLNFLLSKAECGPGEEIVLVAEPSSRYAAAQISEHLISLDHQCIVILTDKEPGDLSRRLECLAAATVVWMRSPFAVEVDLPFAVRKLISFKPGTVTHSASLTVDVWHLEVAPYFAISKNGAPYEVEGGHFFVEREPGGMVLLTSLQQDLLPLFRFAVRVPKVLAPSAFVVPK